MKRYVVMKVVLAAVVCLASTAGASTVITWTNNDPGDSSYNTPGNWDLGVPNVWWDTEVVINGGGAVVHEGADEAGEEGGPREHAGAAGGDGDEAGEDTVAHHAHVVRL